MESVFINTIIPGATKVKAGLDELANIYLHNGDYYVIASASKQGIITQNTKEVIEFKLKDITNAVYLVTLFNKRKDLSESSEDIAWGTFAWFQDSPTHYIHFDNTPFNLTK